MKKRIIDSFAESEENQIKRLLSGLELGDQKPSHYLQRLKSLSAGKINDEVLKALFLERLPEKIRCILAVCDSSDIEKLANQADKILETFSSSTSLFVSEVQQGSESDISKKLEVLISRIDALESRSRPRRQSASGPRSNSRGSRGKHDKCWYHFRFGEKARKCIPPCNFNDAKN